MTTLDMCRDPSPEMNNLIIDTVKMKEGDNVSEPPDPDEEMCLSINDVLSVKEMLENEEVKESIFDEVYQETDGLIKDTSEDPIDLEKNIEEIERNIDN